MCGWDCLYQELYIIMIQTYIYRLIAKTRPFWAWSWPFFSPVAITCSWDSCSYCQYRVIKQWIVAFLHRKHSKWLIMNINTNINNYSTRKYKRIHTDNKLCSHFIYNIFCILSVRAWQNFVVHFWTCNFGQGLPCFWPLSLL